MKRISRQNDEAFMYGKWIAPNCPRPEPVKSSVLPRRLKQAAKKFVAGESAYLSG